jgi:hypothetical protein
LLFKCGEVINWCETYGEILITKDSGVGIILQIEQWHGVKIYKIHRIKYNDIMSFEETHLEKIKKEKKMKLSDQAMGAIMMALQKSLMEQSDITPVLKGMEFDLMDNGELLIKNPPIVKTNANVGAKDA